MLFLGYHADSFRGEHGQWADMLDEIEGTHSEDEAKL